jgi:hypothetical protein
VLSSGLEDLDAGLVVAFQQPEQLAGDDAPEAPLGVASALALGGAAGHLGVGVGIGAQAHQQDRGQGAVELSVAAAVAAVAGHLPGGSGDGVGAGRGGNGCLGAEPSGV